MKRLLISIITAVTLFSNLMILSAPKADLPEPKILWEIKSDLKNQLSGSYEENADDSTYVINEVKLKGLKLEEINDIIVDVKTGSQIGKNKNEQYEVGAGWAPFSVTKYKNYSIRESFDKFQVLRNDDNKKIVDLKKLFGLKVKLLDWMVLEDKNILITCEYETENKIIAYDLNNEGKIIYSVSFKYLDKLTFFGLGGDRIPRFDTFPEINRLVIYNDKKDLNVYDLLTGNLIKENKDAIKTESFTLKKKDGEENIYFYVTDCPSSVNIESFGLKVVDLETGDILKDIVAIEKGKYYSTFFKNDGNIGILAYQKYIAIDSKDNLLIGVDIENSKILWKKSIPTIFYANVEIADDGYYYFDNKFVYKIDKNTGNELWKTALENVKKIEYDNAKKILKAAIGITKATSLSEEFLFKGIAQFDSTNGNLLWKYDSASPMTRIWKMEDNKIIFTNRTSILGLNTDDGTIFLKTEFDVKQKKDEISGGFYLKNKNKMLLLRKETVSLLDIPTNKIEFTTPIKAKFFSSFLFAEVRVIGNYLFVNTVDNAVRVQGGIAGKYNWMIAINMNNGVIMWGLRSGYHEYLGANSLFKYLTNLYTYGVGTHPSSDFFYPRKELFKDNLMVIQTRKSTVGYDSYIMGINVFPDDALPTEDEIKNQFVDIGLSVTKKRNKTLNIEGLLMRRISENLNNLW